MAYSTEVLADSPTAYYRVGESSGATTAVDEVGTHNGTYIGSPTLGVTGAVSGNTAVTLASASSQRINLTTLGTLGQSLITSTWEFWIQTTSTAQGAVFGTFNTGTTQAIQVLLNSNNTGALSAGSTYFYIRDNTGLQFQGSISTNIYDGNLHHVKWTVTSATTYQVRVDKVDQTVSYGLTQSPATFVNFEFPLMVGARNNRGTADLHVNATLDELAFYPTRISNTRSDLHFDSAGSGGASSPAINTNTTRYINQLTRVRFELQEQGGAAITSAYKLRYSRNGGAYTDVGAATDCRYADSASITDGAATTNVLPNGTGTFVAGEGSEDALTGSIALSASAHTEVEFSIVLAGATVVGDTYDLRVYKSDGTALDSYAFTPRITVVAAPVTPAIQQKSIRFRAADSETLNAAFVGGDPAQDADISLPLGFTTPTPATFPSRLSASNGRYITDENGYVLPTMRGFNLHVVPWTAADFTAMNAADTRTTKFALDRYTILWDEIQPTSGTAVSSTYIANLDTQVARSIAAGRYVMLQIHLNTGRIPAWVQTGLDETDRFCKAGANNGQFITEYLAKRYGDPTDPLGAGKYTKAVVGFGLNEPPVNSTTINSTAGSVPYLEDHQGRVFGWMRTYATNWIGFMAWSYASGTPLYEGPGEDTGKTDANPAHACYVNSVIDLHDYTMRVSTENDTDTGRQFNGSVYTFHNGGPLMGPGDELSYTSSPTHKLQHLNFLKPYKDWCTTNNKPLMLGEWGWASVTNNDATAGAGLTTSGEQAFVDDKEIAWATANFAIEMYWNYDTTTDTTVNPWAAKPNGNWRVSVTDWLAQAFVDYNSLSQISSVFRLRVKVQETNGGAVSTGYKLKYSKNGGAYGDVTSITDIRSAFSASFNKGDATSNLLTGGTGTFVAGEGTEDAQTNSISLPASGNTDLEFALAFTGNAAVGNTFDLRVYRLNGSAFDTYTITPRVTVVSGGADTTAPTTTFGSQTVTKISRITGKDSVNITITTNEPFVEYELRLVASESSTRASGTQIETAVVSSRSSHTVTVTDDELVAAGAVEGLNRIKAFTKDAAGNWST
jgi:hypothetical protein